MSTITYAGAQNASNIINLFGGIMQSAIIQAAQSEWKRLSDTEILCVDQALRQRGLSLQALIAQGVAPSDARIAVLRASCRAQFVEQPPQPTKASTQSSKYVVDGLPLGNQVRFDSVNYRQYKCVPSDQFPEFTWCTRRLNERSGRQETMKSNSILHSADGTALYVNSYIEPASFGADDIANEIKRLSAKFGEPARVLTMPRRAGLPEAVIASWGQVELKPFDSDDMSILASGGRPTKGLFIDYLGDFVRSAKQDLPVYLLSGGAPATVAPEVGSPQKP